MKCKLCASKKTIFLFNAKNLHGRHLWGGNKTFKIFRCLGCESLFVGEIEVNDQYYEKYYPAGYYDGEQSYKGLVKRILNLLGRFSLKRKQGFILKNTQLKGGRCRLLDIGCGEGNFLSGLDSSLFEKYGIEINKKAYKMCLRKGLKVYNQELIDIDFQGKKFNVVTLWHVLEHIEKPAELFNKVHQILENNGILIFATPNTDSLGFKWGEKNWFHLDSPRHLILYNQKSISWLLEKSRFKIIEAKNEFYDYPLDIFWSVRKSKVKFLVYLLYPFFKIFSKEHLTFVCKKKELMCRNTVSIIKEGGQFNRRRC